VPRQLLSWHVDSRDGVVVITVSGAFDAKTGPALFRAVMQCLAREPAAILADLSGMTVTEPAAARIFSTIVQQADVWPGTPLVLCVPAATTATLIKGVAGEAVPVFDTVPDGLAALIDRDELITELLRPVPGTPRRARDIVTEACLRWKLPHLVTPAVLVTSELITNAVEHAHTDMALQVRLRPRYLYVAVYDGGHAEPVRRDGSDMEAPGGRGLQLVQSVSARWGYLRRTDGKVVWASVATS